MKRHRHWGVAWSWSARGAISAFALLAACATGCDDSETNVSPTDAATETDGLVRDGSASDAAEAGARETGPDATTDTAPAETSPDGGRGDGGLGVDADAPTGSDGSVTVDADAPGTDTADTASEADAADAADAMGATDAMGAADALGDVLDDASDGSTTEGGTGETDATVGADAAPEVASDGATDAFNWGNSTFGDSGLTVHDVLKFYRGDWGSLLLRQHGNAVWGVYPSSRGTMVLQPQGDALVGWWTEESATDSRQPPHSAGEVEFRFSSVNDRIVVDGRWRYGTSGTWDESWDLLEVTDEQPPGELLTRLSATEEFIGHP